MKAICGGTLITCCDQDTVSDGVVLIKGDSIVYAGHRDEVKELELEAAEQIDARDMWIMPGLIDGHIHLYMDGESSGFFEFPIHHNPIDMALKAIPALKRTLEMGFTTIRDGGSGYGWFEVSLREAIEQRIIVGPRLLTSGYHLTVMGGHGYFLPHWLGKYAPAEQIGMHVDGPDAWRKGARINLYNGVDTIKVVASRAATVLKLRGDGPPTASQATVKEMQAAIEEAHKMGKKTIAHAHGKDAIRKAIMAGIDTIVHGLYLDVESVDMMVQHNVSLEPTTYLLEIAWQKRAEELGPEKTAWAKQYRIQRKDELQMARDKGVAISLGSDAGGIQHFYHGESALELADYVTLGLSPMEAILSATRTAAETVGLADKIGTIEKGKLADIILVRNNPLDDIAVLTRKKNIALVMKEGEILVRR